MQGIAFITYNTLDGIASGWTENNEHRALILQNTKGEGSRQNGSPIGADNRIEQLDALWPELRQAMPTIDHVVVYVGYDGSERAIFLASQMPVEKVTFVMCDCGTDHKVAMIAAVGLKRARRVNCECGGHLTMARMVHHFLATGELYADL